MKKEQWIVLEQLDEIHMVVFYMYYLEHNKPNIIPLTLDDFSYYFSIFLHNNKFHPEYNYESIVDRVLYYFHNKFENV